MVSFRGQKKLGPCPDWSPLRIQFKISDLYACLGEESFSPGHFS